MPSCVGLDECPGTHLHGRLRRYAFLLRLRREIVGFLLSFFAIGGVVCFLVLLFGALRGAVADASETPEEIEKSSHLEG